MRYYLNKKYAFKEYDDFGVLFAKIGNPKNEFYELNMTGRMIIKLIYQNSGATQEEIYDYLHRNLSENDTAIENDIVEFLHILKNKSIVLEVE